MIFSASGSWSEPGARSARHTAGRRRCEFLAEATLTVVLFADASGSICGPSTGVCGAGAAARLRAAVDDRSRRVARRSALRRTLFTEALVLAVLLAPTDAALGQAVVTEPRLPSRIRQGLNVESGLNDGICVPLLFIVLAVAETDANEMSARTLSDLLSRRSDSGSSEACLLAPLRRSDRVRRESASDRSIVASDRPGRGSRARYGIAAPLDGSGFIAAFVAGMTFGVLRRPAQKAEVTFLRGARRAAQRRHAPRLRSGSPLAGARRSQLADRPLRAREPDRRPHAAGRRCDAGHGRSTTNSRVPRLVRPARAGVDRVRRDRRQEADLPHATTICSRPTSPSASPSSSTAHGRALARRYATWFASHPQNAIPAMESVPAGAHRWRRPSATVELSRGGDLKVAVFFAASGMRRSPTGFDAMELDAPPNPAPGCDGGGHTAVFATGDGPGVTAVATTAVFATGAPMTPTLPHVLV